jgi:RNA polymerase sigma factor (sigma-70 family)
MPVDALVRLECAGNCWRQVARVDLDALISRHWDGLKARALSALRDAHAAEDITQEAFAILWAAHTRGATIDDPGGFLNGTLRRLVITAIRGKSRKRELWNRFIGSREARVKESADCSAEMQEGVSRLVERLWPEGRALIVGRYYLGMTLDELAAELSIPRSTAHERYRKAMERLRELAREDGLLD